MKNLKITVLIAFGATFLLASCTGEKNETKQETSTNVEVYTPSNVSSEGFYLTGEIKAKQTAMISTRMMGYVKKIHVKPGDKVAAGQLLVSISSDDVLAKKAQVQAMITEVEAAAKNAQRDYERFKRLREQNSVSDKELENVALQNTSMNAKLQMARQQMNEVNAMLAYTNIKSPFSGIVTQKMMDEGSMANPGMPILVIEQNGELEIEASVPESYMQYVKVGDMAQVEVKSLGVTLNGRVSELSPSAYRTGGQYSLKLALDTHQNSNIHSGMFVNIQFQNKIEDTVSNKILIAESSLVKRDQLTGVYIVDDQNQANLRWIRLGKKVEDQVEVVSGLSKDDKIVMKADSKLYNGKKVTITNK